MFRARLAHWIPALVLGASFVACAAPRASVLQNGIAASDLRVLDSYGDIRIPAKPGPDRDAVKAKLAEARKRHVAQLETYVNKGAFPVNRAKPIIANIFRDEDGHLCAVANMVWIDGNRDLVDDTAKHENFVRVAEKDSGKLYDWAITSGFTREEIAMIQVPYMPIGRGPGRDPRDPLVGGPIHREPGLLGWIDPAAEQAAAFARARTAEKKRLQGHLTEVAKRLVDDTDQSLDIATDRLLAAPDRDARLAALGLSDTKTG